jgi:membrane protein DedA with SNARE-associated domain
MTMLAGMAAVAMATCVGYYFGRRAGSTRSTWKKRTSRLALGRLVISLLVLLTARRIRQLRALRLIAPVELLQGSVARMRS